MFLRDRVRRSRTWVPGISELRPDFLRSHYCLSFELDRFTEEEVIMGKQVRKSSSNFTCILHCLTLR